jgi:hypothetical protein
MADIMKNGIDSLKATMLAFASVDIVYHRGGTSVNLKAWVGNTLFKIMDREGQRMQWGDRDYLIPVENLKIGGVLVEPLKGDWIEEKFASVWLHYELSAPNNEPVWRYDDLYNSIYLLHTKRVS